MADVDYFDLGVTFGLDPSQSKTKIKDLPAYGSWPAIANSITNAKLRYPDAYGRQNYIGWTDEQFLNLSACSAAALQAVWYGQFGQWGADIWSRVNVDIPAGDYFMTVPFPKAMGQYIGKGPHLGWNPRQAATCLHVWKDQWQGPASEDRFAMRSANWGKTDVGDAWMHGGYVDSIGFVGNNGNNWYDPNSPAEHGLGLWDEGEASNIGRIYSADWNGYGIMAVRGTPFTASSVLSVFTNALGGVGLIGSQLSSIRIGTVSGDDNAAMVVMADGFGRKAGGNIRVDMVKSESGKRPINHGQIVLWQRNPCVGNISFGSVQADQNGVYNDAAFVLNNREWGQVLNVDAFVGWNLCTLVHDVSNKKRWPTSSYRPESFVYCSRNGGTLFDLTTGGMMGSGAVNATDRLGMASSPSGFDYAAGTPAYSLTGGVTPPVPVACTGWEAGPWGSWGPCVNGQQTRTRTVTATPAGCTIGTPPNKPTDTETQACSTPPTLTATAFAEQAAHTAQMAVDGNPNTFWQANKGMASGQWFQLTLSAAKALTGITFSVPYPIYKWWPPKYDVQVSADGTAWTTVVTGATGAATSTATWASVSARYVKIVCKASASDWWAITEVTVQ